ncbi:MAG: hypothetical protein QM541_13250 [Flavobacterium sp.]|nr:hypothetical protein [Flavobacterium sp.]
MRSNHFILACLLLFCFTSCQKSIEWNDLILTPTTPSTPGGGTTTGTLLVKAVSISLTDTATALYTYDASKKLIKSQTVGTSSLSKIDNTTIYTRNSSGNVVKLTEIGYSAVSLNSSGYDTIESTIHYPTGSNNFDYAVSTQKLFGFVFNDSTVLVYTGGKITRQITYTTSFFTSVYDINRSIDFIYDASGNNIVSAKTYSYTTGSAVLVAEFIFAHDSKKSPLALGNDAFFSLGPSAYGTNNVIKYDSNDPAVPLNSYSVVFAFNYNTNGYPTDATITATRYGIALVTKSTLFYQ